MVTSRLAILSNPQSVPLSDVPLLDHSEFRSELSGRMQREGRLSALFGFPQGPEHTRLFAVIGDPRTGRLAVCSTMVGDRYESLSTSIPQAHSFEREIAEQWGIRPEGHPQFQPIRYHASYRPGHNAWHRDSTVDLRRQVQDQDSSPPTNGLVAVSVGPLQAGVTESGRFRFQCAGETIQDLELEFGYQYRGIEQALLGRPNKKTIHLIESLAGDTTVGHATAYSQALEALAVSSIPMRAQIIRGVALELERLIWHSCDLGRLSDEVGFLPTAGACGRLCHEFQEILAILCGNRQGYSLIRPGGVSCDSDIPRCEAIQSRMARTMEEIETTVKFLWTTPSVQSRFEDCGVLQNETCEHLGLVGPIARACGCEIDVRHDFPSGIYRFHQLAVSTVRSGDVLGRAFIRWLEIQRSAEFIQQQLEFLKRLKPGPRIVPLKGLRPEALAVSLVEGWRGEICHVAITDGEGKLARYKICDPSFHNWPALGHAVKNQPLSDFPLIYKSLSLSICGHDL